MFQNGCRTLALLQHSHFQKLGRGRGIQRHVDGSASGQAHLVRDNLAQDKGPRTGAAIQAQDVRVAGGMKIESAGKG